MASTPRILQNGKMPLAALDTQLLQEFQVHRLVDEPDPQAFLAAHGAEFVGLVTSAGVGASAPLIKALPNLQVLSSFGVGYDSLDKNSLLQSGVQVSNTPGVLDDCVADCAFALLLDVSRGISQADRFVRRGEWQHKRFGIQTRVSGKRLGIFGMGRIGQTVARRAQGFDMEVAYHNRRPVADSPPHYFDSLQKLARWADYLVITASGGESTHHLVNEEVLQALGPQGFLINVARGSVVDETALVSALQNKNIAGAGLDVFENEPKVPEALFSLDNVVLLPHIASGTQETRHAMAELVLDNLRSFFATGQVKTPVPWTRA